MSKIEKLEPIINELKMRDVPNMRGLYNSLCEPNGYTQKRENATLAHKAPAGISRHHSYEGGLFDHLLEMYYYAKLLQIKEKFFITNMSSLAKCILLHDIEKTIIFNFKTEGDGLFEYDKELQNWIDDHSLRMLLINGFNISLTPEELMAIQWSHGGWSPIEKQGNKYLRNIPKLGIALHILDLLSSQFQGRDYDIPYVF